MPGDDSSGMELLGLGMSMLDVLHVVEQFPDGSGVTAVRRSATMGGGPVPTALCAAARLGAAAGIIDRIGDDWRGALIAEDYAKFGVDCRHLLREEDRTSSFGTVLVRESDGERHVVFGEGDFTPLAASELPRDALERCEILHLNGRHWPACVEAAKVVRDAGGRVSFDGGAHRHDPKFGALLPLVDILVVARDFAERCAGSEERDEQLEDLAKSGAAIVGITDGIRGSWFRGGAGDTFHQPAFPAESVVDTTGCGDVFHGAFLFALLRGDSCREAARFASAAAALSATGLGGRGRLPARGEVEGLVNLPVALSVDRM